MQKMLLLTDGIIQKVYKNIWFFYIVEFMKSKKRGNHNARATAHRWRQTPGMKPELNCTLF